MPRFILSGVSAGVGKSLVGIGLAHEFRRRNIGISVGVIGPSLVQAMIYRRLSARYCRSLDERLLSPGQLITSVYQAGIGADLLMIEGRDGLYDGEAGTVLSGSDAEFAALTRSPVILVADTRAFGSSLVALLKGYAALASGFHIAGVILNRLDPRPATPQNFQERRRDQEYYDLAFQAFGFPASLGGVPELANAVNLSSLGFSQQKNLSSLPRQFFVDLSKLLAEHVDIEQILVRASDVVSIKLTDLENKPSARRCRIAVTDDNCFHLCIQDNLDLLRYYGAEIVSFSPLADSQLPKRVGAVYLTGAYLGEYGQELSNNTAMKKAISDFASQGGVVYSEGSGTAYLCRDFKSDPSGEALEGVGLICGSAVYEQYSPQHIEAVTVEDSILGRPGLIMKGLSSGEWRLEKEDRVVRILRVSRAGSALYHEGFSPEAQCIGTFMFAHFGSNPEIAKNLVDAAEVVQRI